MREIPVVDLRAPDIINLSEAARRQRNGQRIMQALEGIGFVYLKNTDISDQLRQATVDSALKFFALPLEEKMKYHRFVATKSSDGYTPISEEQLFYSEKDSDDRKASELKESYDLMFADGVLPRDIAPAFADNALQLMVGLEKLSQYVYAVAEESLGRPGLLTGSHTRQLGRQNASVFRTVHYPPVPEQAARPGQVRCCMHSDWGSFTLLLQDQVGGLEVLARDDTWVPATPIPDTVLVNVGDLMEIWTGGRVRATKHRVRYPDTVEQCRAHRVSLVFFGQPDDETIVAPPIHAAAEEAPSVDATAQTAPPRTQFPTVNAGEYLRQKYLATMPNANNAL